MREKSQSSREIELQFERLEEISAFTGRLDTGPDMQRKGRPCCEGDEEKITEVKQRVRDRGLWKRFREAEKG